MKKAPALLLTLAALSLAGAASAKVVNIGYSGPLSGGAAAYGKDTQSGIQMAIDEINAAGGVTVGSEKVTFNLVSLDDRYLPNETATNVKRLTSQGIDVIFVPHSGGIQTVQALNTRDNPFLLVAYSSEPKILAANNALTFMLPPRYDNYLTPFTKQEMSSFGKKLGFVGTTSAYGKAWADAISGEWTKQGGTLGSNNGVDYSTTVDYSSAVTKALAEKPDVLFVGGPSQPTALVIKAAREQGFKGGFIVMDQAKYEQMATVVPASMLDGMVGVLPLAQVPGTQSFLVDYQRRFKRAAGTEASYNFIGMNVVAQAMSLAGTATDPTAIRAKLSQAATSLPQGKRIVTIRGVTAQGHLDSDPIATFVSGGKLNKLRITNIK